MGGQPYILPNFPKIVSNEFVPMDGPNFFVDPLLKVQVNFHKFSEPFYRDLNMWRQNLTNLTFNRLRRQETLDHIKIGHSLATK